jgi:amino acid transporter
MSALAVTVRNAWVRRRHTTLLIAIVAALGVRPLIGDTGAAPQIFGVALLLLLVTALFAVHFDELVGEKDMLAARRRRRNVILFALAAAALAERVYVTVASSPQALVVGTVIWLLFLAFVTSSQLRSLLAHREVTSETISMSISIYLLFGMTCGVLYVLVFQLQPDAFRFGEIDAPSAHPTSPHIFQMLIYFSLTTLSTVGFGDITPTNALSRFIAVAEALAGQMYLAILVARLVGARIGNR